MVGEVLREKSSPPPARSEFWTADGGWFWVTTEFNVRVSLAALRPPILSNSADSELKDQVYQSKITSRNLAHRDFDVHILFLTLLL